MQGENDIYGLPQQVMDIVQGIGPHAMADIIAECGHCPHLEQPEYCIKKIATFIQNCRQSQLSLTEI
jgi:pimeloyl-ACP methyl ester carboxylesterase